MTPEEFRKRILEEPSEDILNNILLNDEAIHVTIEQKNEIQKIIAQKFKVDIETVRIIVVGSAKLGFSISEKRKKDKPTLPRYRAYSASSDIDLAIICPAIFDQVWNELSKYSLGLPYYPWISNRFGDYLVCGWIRPDHFPKSNRLRKCHDWYYLFINLTTKRFFGRRSISAGLFYNFEQLKTYQAKALKECIEFENLNP